MKTFKIDISSIDKVKNFVERVNAFKCDIDLVSGRYRINAKSIMGIFSLDISKPLIMEVQDDAVADDVKSALNDFII